MTLCHRPNSISLYSRHFLYTLPDGIYILCDTTDSSLPSHLAALVGTQPPTKERLRWNVSGMATSKTSQYSRRHVSAMNERHERFADYNKNATMWSQVSYCLVNNTFYVQERLTYLFAFVILCTLSWSRERKI